jgi:hypothetical protein
MADNINSLTISILLVGVLLLALTSSFILLVENEGRGEILQNYSQITSLKNNLTSATGQELISTSNINSNLSADYNPEIAISSADQSGNAIGINLQELVTTFGSLFLILGGLIFGNIFTSVIGIILISILSYQFTYYFIRWIRSGN